MRNKHILFVFRSLGTGGSQKIQAFVANACIKRGFEVTILSMSNEKCTLDIHPKINIITLDYDSIINNRNNIISYSFKRMQYLFHFRKICKKIKPDLVCPFLIDIVRLTVIALKYTPYFVLGSERGDPSQFSQKKIKQYNKALNKCTGVVFQLEEAAAYYSLQENVIKEIIPNPSIVRNSDIDVLIKDKEDKFIFGAGRLTNQKRFDVLINAYKIVYNYHPEYRLKIYGDGIESANLKKHASILGLESQVDFVGDVKNIFQDVNSSSIFVLSSDFEGIPNVITEALINGIPCISTDCSPGGARLLLDEGKAGDIVECGNYRQLAQSIIKYIENPDSIKERVLHGKEYIKKFSPSIIEKDWIHLFERILYDGK